MPAAPFPDRPRVDALDKVRGATLYPADIAVPERLFAMMVTSRIVKGTLAGLDTAAAMNVPGVVRVLTPADFPPPPAASEGGPPPPPPTLETKIAYRGQPIALVVAETLEAAIEGAEAVRSTFDAEGFAPLMESEGATRVPAKGVEYGDVEQGMRQVTTLVDVTYVSPTQHHNPIELLATTAIWADGRLTIHECSQNTSGVKNNVARALRLDPAIIDVKSEYVGGAFGQKGGYGQRQTAIVARAAILIGRPVKLVLPRGQIFHVATYRPFSRHRVQLGADTNGKLVAMRYDAEHENSRAGTFGPSNYHETTALMYAVPNYAGTAANIRIDRQAPGFMRAPHPHPAHLALEGAMDELAYKLGVDPVAFRLAHDQQMDPRSGHPQSSRFLNECLEEGARRFGWSRRSPEPASMTAPDGAQVGWGVACGAYPALQHATIAKLRIGADGSTRFAVAGHEFGQGIRTLITAALVENLNIDPAKLEILIGDTTVAFQHVTAGSWGSASVAPVAVKAAAQMRAAVAELLAGRKIPGNLHQQLAGIRRPFLQVEVSRVGPGQPETALDALRRGAFAVTGPEYPTFTSISYIAHFVEVRVEPHTRRVRVPRVVSIADCGRVVSPRTAVSQVHGGVTWGISAALREATEIDPRFGGYLNNDLADYVVAVNADIGEIDVGFVDRPDPLMNDIGVKGLGEVAMVGAAAAVVNAVYHATGRRLRQVPIRPEHLL